MQLIIKDILEMMGAFITTKNLSLYTIQTIFLKMIVGDDSILELFSFQTPCSVSSRLLR
jgi:hypothetical protein